jgi:hypothetical protein
LLFSARSFAFTQSFFAFICIDSTFHLITSVCGTFVPSSFTLHYVCVFFSYAGFLCGFHHVFQSAGGHISRSLLYAKENLSRFFYNGKIRLPSPSLSRLTAALRCVGRQNTYPTPPLDAREPKWTPAGRPGRAAASNCEQSSFFYTACFGIAPRTG